MARIRVTPGGSRPNQYVIQSIFRDRNGPVGEHLDRLSLAVLAEARRRVPVRTGTLLTSLRREFGAAPGRQWVDVVAGVRGLTTYLGFVLRGTSPHIIRPRRRKALRFIHGGQLVFARSVRHPGTRARPFLTEALDVIK